MHVSESVYHCHIRIMNVHCLLWNLPPKSVQQSQGLSLEGW